MSCPIASCYVYALETGVVVPGFGVFTRYMLWDKLSMS